MRRPGIPTQCWLPRRQPQRSPSFSPWAETRSGSALVASLARPSGNLTGVNFFSAELAAKRLELLRELVPAAARIAVLVNPPTLRPETTIRDAEAAARAVGLQVQALNARNAGEIDAVFAPFVHERPDALFVDGGALFNSRRVQLVHLATRHALPAVIRESRLSRNWWPDELWNQHSGWLSSGGPLYRAYPQGARSPQICRLCRAIKFELVINAQTARTLGLTVPAFPASPRRRGDRMRAARVRHTAWRCGGGVAAHSVCAAGGNAGDWILAGQSREGRAYLTAALKQGLSETGYYRRPEREYRVPLGRKSIRPPAGDGGRASQS